MTDNRRHESYAARGARGGPGGGGDRDRGPQPAGGAGRQVAAENRLRNGQFPQAVAARGHGADPPRRLSSTSSRRPPAPGARTSTPGRATRPSSAACWPSSASRGPRRSGHRRGADSQSQERGGRVAGHPLGPRGGHSRGQLRRRPQAQDHVRRRRPEGARRAPGGDPRSGREVPGLPGHRAPRHVLRHGRGAQEDHGPVDARSGWGSTTTRPTCTTPAATKWPRSGRSSIASCTSTSRTPWPRSAWPWAKAK